MCAFREMFYHKVKPYFQSALTILQIGIKDAVWRRLERAEVEQSDKKNQTNDGPTLHLMYVVVCDGLCVGAHAY